MGKGNFEIVMTTWSKSDWKRFYEAARRPWRHRRPPRPVYPTGLNRVLPAQGFSLSELDDAGVNLELAERLGLPVDAGDRKSTRLNSSHGYISYAVFCLKKKKKTTICHITTHPR